MIDETAYVHTRAWVDGTVTIGARTKVWQFANIIRGTVIGSDCRVSAFANLDGPKLGNRVKVSPGVDMGPGFQIEDDVFLGPNVVLCNDFWPRADEKGFDYAALRAGTVICVIVGKGASIGANTVIMPGITIGAAAMVASGTKVVCDVPPNCLYAGPGDIRAIRDEDRAMARRMRYVETPYECAVREGSC